MYNVRGFVLTELLIALAILLLIGAAATPLYSRLYVGTQLSSSRSDLSQTLSTARTRARARLNDASHGVYLQAQSYTLYQGSSYASRTTAYDQTIALDSALTLSTAPSVTDLVFSKGLARPSATTTITLTHDVHGTATITIDALGTVLP